MSQPVSENNKSYEVSENFTGAFEQELLKTEPEKYLLRLYIAGSTPKSLRALEKIQKICKQYLQGRYQL